MKPPVLPFGINTATVRVVGARKKRAKKAVSSELLMRVAQELQAAFEESEQTQTEVAKATGQSQGNISRVFGSVSPRVSFETVARCAAHFDISLDAAILGRRRMSLSGFVDTRELRSAGRGPEGAIQNISKEVDGVPDLKLPKGDKGSQRPNKGR